MNEAESSSIPLMPGDAIYITLYLKKNLPPTLELDITGTQVKLSWHDAVHPDGYLLYYSTTDQMDDNQFIDMGKQETLEFDGKGFSFYVQIRSYTGRYQSNFSEIVSFDLR
jgi:hypothetical protein